MKKVISTSSITGFEKRAMGLRRTSESHRTFLEKREIRLLAASLPLSHLDVSSAAKSIHVSLEVRQNRAERQEREKGQHDQHDDATHKHYGEDSAVRLETPFAHRPFSPYHRAGEGQQQAYGGVTPNYDHDR